MAANTNKQRTSPKASSVRLRFCGPVTEVGLPEGRCSLSKNGTKGRRIEAQGLEDGRRHLGGAHFGADSLRLERRIGQQQNDIRVVMGEPAELRQFRRAAGVSHADVRGDDDVRRARVCGWFVVVQREGRAVVDLPELDSGGGGEDAPVGVVTPGRRSGGVDFGRVEVVECCGAKTGSYRGVCRVLVGPGCVSASLMNGAEDAIGANEYP